MERFTDTERKYVLEALGNEFSTSRNGIFNGRLEKAFADKIGVRFAIGHVNGTATMHTALAALGVKPGDEVIVPPLTMSSTALAVLHNGSVPVFADVDPETFNIDAASVRARVTDSTRAVISVALYGLAPDYDALLAVCRERGLYLIEDNAECLLGEYRGAAVGRQGHFASFSFQASKHITCGEGGMLTTNDEGLADRARRFSSLGYAGVSAKQGKITRNDIQDPNYNRHVAIGFNYRMSEVNAAVVLGQLERADELVANRIRVAKLFDEAIRGVDYVQRQALPDGYLNSYWSYSWVLKSNKPEQDWYVFRDLFQKNGGDGFYAAWKLSYMEPLFLNEVQHMAGVRQKYAPGLCPTAEYLQPRMVQMKTNYWDLEEAARQAHILKHTVHSFRPQ
jgi:perosamine synthetase